MNKRGLSPIIATILLIAFAVAIGAMIMNWTADITTEMPSCEDLPGDILDPNAFCKTSYSIIPRIIAENQYVLCEDHEIELGFISEC